MLFASINKDITVMNIKSQLYEKPNNLIEIIDLNLNNNNGVIRKSNEYKKNLKNNNPKN